MSAFRNFSLSAFLKFNVECLGRGDALRPLDVTPFLFPGWQFWEGRNAQYTVVLGIPPVDSPNAAVRGSIAAEAKQMDGNSQ
jgi:hypothetical protein